MSKNEYKTIKEYLDKEGSIFDTLTITIGLVGINNNGDNSSKMYKISKIVAGSEGDLDRFNKVREIIIKLNQEIINTSNTGFKESDKDSGWSIFFLIKECIQILSRDEFNFKYYRGQRNGSWKTVPSAFRDISNDKGTVYCEEFEDIYKEIHKKFPEKINYIEFPEMDLSDDCKEKMKRRGEQLALLQHYELYTPLLDITSNPFIALLFMISGQLNEPQLEFYDISDTLLFMDPDKTELNNRILAQKGAFLNFEMLLSKKSKNISILEEIKSGNNNLKIPRIVLKIQYLKDETDKIYNEEQKQSSEIKDKLINKGYFNTPLLSEDKFSIEKNKEDVYQDVLEHIRKKLEEFKYFEDDLFPDFEDFLKNRMKLFNYHNSNDIK